MLGVIYPLMMKELGISYIALASLAAVYEALASRGVITLHRFGPAFTVISTSYLCHGSACVPVHSGRKRLHGGLSYIAKMAIAVRRK
jgi:hypothetical protein